MQDLSPLERLGRQCHTDLCFAEAISPDFVIATDELQRGKMREEVILMDPGGALVMMLAGNQNRKAVTEGLKLLQVLNRTPPVAPIQHFSYRGQIGAHASGIVDTDAGPFEVAATIVSVEIPMPPFPGHDPRLLQMDILKIVVGRLHEVFVHGDFVGHLARVVLNRQQQQLAVLP